MLPIWETGPILILRRSDVYHNQWMLQISYQLGRLVVQVLPLKACAKLFSDSRCWLSYHHRLLSSLDLTLHNGKCGNETKFQIPWREGFYLKKNAAVSINVGPWVLGFALFQENVWHNLVELSNQLEHGIVRQVLQGKLTLALVARICFTEHCMSVAGNNLQPMFTELVK